MSFAQMTQIQSYAATVPDQVGNIFNPAHAITAPLKEKTTKAFDSFSLGQLLALVGISIALIGLMKK